MMRDMVENYPSPAIQGYAVLLIGSNSVFGSSGSIVGMQ